MEGRLQAVRWTPPVVGKQFAFDETLTALRFLKSGKSVGKVCVRACACARV